MGGTARARFLTREKLSAIGRVAGFASRDARTPEERTDSARHAALARWASRG